MLELLLLILILMALVHLTRPGVLKEKQKPPEPHPFTVQRGDTKVHMGPDETLEQAIKLLDFLDKPKRIPYIATHVINQASYECFICHRPLIEIHALKLRCNSEDQR